MHIDVLGRRRSPAQHAGLRPLFPKLPSNFVTCALRVAMPDRSWQALDQLVAASSAPTRPRAVGEVVSALLGRAGNLRPAPQPPVAIHEPAEREYESGRADWLGWQLQKEQALLGLHWVRDRYERTKRGL